MSTRKQRLGRLGIEVWVQRTDADDEASGNGASSVAPGALTPHQAEEEDVEAPVSVPEPVFVAPAPTSPPAVVEVRPSSSVPVASSAYADWSSLEAAVASCTRCGLCPTRTQTVFGTGARDAPLMIVGEGPGADEDASGLPFVGRAGKLLDEMLAAIGHSRERNVYIANVVKCRPPGNRDPAPDEAESCRPYLEAQIALIQPKLIVALGRIAAQRLLATDLPLARLRGPLHHYGPAQTPLLVTYHPAYLLRSPREKAKSWQDLKGIWQRLHGQPT